MYLLDRTGNVLPILHVQVSVMDETEPDWMDKLIDGGVQKASVLEALHSSSEGNQTDDEIAEPTTKVLLFRYFNFCKYSIVFSNSFRHSDIKE